MKFFLLWFTNGRQKFDCQRVKRNSNCLELTMRNRKIATIRQRLVVSVSLMVFECKYACVSVPSVTVVALFASENLKTIKLCG